jgi:hypothetical protein
MGREIRRVPPNWKHPKDDKGNYKSMYDEDFDTALQNWLSDYNLWKEGKHGGQQGHPERLEMPFWEWSGGPPDPEYCRPKFKEEPTWFQVYETVSEGSPVTPPFPTKDELYKCLVEVGDFWGERWSPEAAKSFIEHEWAPSGMIVGGKFLKSNEIII